MAEDTNTTSEDKRITSEDRRTVLQGMFRDWYLEYASYAIRERAVPHIRSEEHTSELQSR